jgi:dual-specificity kinase
MKIVDNFEFTKDKKTYYAIVTEHLGYSLYDYIKKNKYKGYPISYVQTFAKQIITGLSFIHKCNMIHSDLKPENILFSTKRYVKKYISSEHNYDDNNNYYKDSYHKHKSSYNYYNNQKSSSTNMNSHHTTTPNKYYHNYNKYYSKDKHKHIYKYYLPDISESNELKIIDFGGALYKSMINNNVISTRQYRPPEDILGCSKWNDKSDMWSIGCILFELYCGELLFPTHNDDEHLCMIEKVCGAFPEGMICKAKKSRERIFYINYNRINYNTINSEIRKNVRDIKTINEIVLKEHKEFKRLLLWLLEIDPNKRPTCEEALQHSFFGIRYKDE